MKWAIVQKDQYQHKQLGKVTILRVYGRKADIQCSGKRMAVVTKYFQKGITKKIRRGYPVLKDFGGGWHEVLVRRPIPKTRVVILKKMAVCG